MTGFLGLPETARAGRSKALSRFDTRRQIDAGGVGLLAGLVGEGADGAVDRMLLPAQSQAAALVAFRVTDKDRRGPITWPREPRGFVLRFRRSTAIY